MAKQKKTGLMSSQNKRDYREMKRVKKLNRSGESRVRKILRDIFG